MKKNLTIIAAAFVAAFLLAAEKSHSFSSIANAVNDYCAPRGVTPFTGDCNLCHANADNFNAAFNGNYDHFCPLPSCTDSDGDGYALEGGSCGAVDCNDNDAAVHPGAAENCTDGVDNNCNGLVDAQDSAAVGCPAVCTDNDGDGYALEGGDCGQVDCDDTDGTVFPGAAENCTDGIDNNCNGLVDSQDTAACEQAPSCTDSDGDNYALEGGACGPVDCDDNDASVSPGIAEFCGDAIDNDCDGSIDEGCDAACPDVDGDTYLDAACGGTDCDDNDAAINPAAAEVCGNGIDENCNGASDDVCQTCPDGSVLVIKEIEYDRGDEKLKVKGRASVGNTITITNADTGEILAEDVKVKEGKWKVRIKGVEEAPAWVSAITSDGCAVDEEVKIKSRRHGHHDNDDDDHDEDDDHRADRDNSRSWRGWKR